MVIQTFTSQYLMIASFLYLYSFGNKHSRMIDSLAPYHEKYTLRVIAYCFPRMRDWADEGSIHPWTGIGRKMTGSWSDQELNLITSI